MTAWHQLRIDPQRLRSDVETLSKIGRAPDGNLTRQSFTEPYEEARAWLYERFAEADIASRDDDAGNAIGRVGPAGPCVMSGSHIDTVLDGGPLDGAYGVLAALECARVLHEARLPLPLAFEAVALVEEEGRYLDCMGSRVMTGQFSPEEIERARSADGELLTEAMTRHGFDLGAVGQAVRPAEDLAAYVEIHIEQGPVLEAHDIPIGVVEAIVGVRQADFYFNGEPDHAGTAPMDLRKDALMGAAEFIYKSRRMALSRGSPSTRLTYGIIEARPQATSIVPYEVRVRQELRDPSDETVDRLATNTRRLATRTAKRRNLSARCEPLPPHPGAQMTPRIQDIIEAAAHRLELTSLRMPSGAGHDAQLFAKVTPTGMIFVPSMGGRSHRRDEWTDWPYLEHGANVLLQTVLHLIFEGGNGPS